jgi:hypothetical protein
MAHGRYFTSAVDFRASSFMDNAFANADGWKVYDNFLVRTALVA